MIGKKLNAPIDAYRYLEKLPLDQIAYLLAESSNSAALSKIRAYLNKWRPVRIGLPVVANELEALGMARGQKFDAIVEQVFAIQLTGRGKTPEEREKILRKLVGDQGSAEEKREREEGQRKAAEKAARQRLDSAAKQSHGSCGGKAAHQGASTRRTGRQGRRVRRRRTERVRLRKEEQRPEVVVAARSREIFLTPVGNVENCVSQFSCERFRIEFHGSAAVRSSSRSHGLQSARRRLRNHRAS